MPQNNMEVTISNNCSNGYQIPCNLAITSNQGAWSYDFTLTVHAPDFTFGYYVAQDTVETTMESSIRVNGQHQHSDDQ
jgi:hypothetical protein